MIEKTSKQNPITILIVDDHTLLREAWTMILNADPRFCVVAETGTGEEAVELARKLKPQVVIMDINLPGINGIEATELIKKKAISSAVLGISLHGHPSYAKRMMQKGAKGYITKSSSREDMFTALEEVAKGNKYICQEIKDALAHQIMETEESPAKIEALTEREIQIIKLTKNGYSARQISEALNLASKTVEVHKHNIYKKLNVKNVTSLINLVNNISLEI